MRIRVYLYRCSECHTIRAEERRLDVGSDDTLRPNVATCAACKVPRTMEPLLVHGMTVELRARV